MKTRVILFLIFIPLCFLFAQEKNVKKSFKVNPSQRVFINGVSSLQLKIIGWDKNEADVNIKAKVNTSDSRFGKEYLQNFDVSYKTDGNDIIVDFLETSGQGSWNPLQIFKGDFKYSFSKEISGEIYLPKGVTLIGNFMISDITVSNLDESIVLKGKGSHFSVKGCKKVSEISNEYGDAFISRSSGKLNTELKISPLTIEDFEGQAKINTYGASVNVNRFDGSLNISAYNTKGTVEDISGGVVYFSEISDFSFKKIKGILHVNDKSGIVKVYDVNGFKLEGSKTDLTADKIIPKAKEKIFLTTKYGSYRISNSSGAYFIDDDYSHFSLTGMTGNIFYSASNGKFTGSDIKGDWKSDTKYSEINLNSISASLIDATGRGKLFKASISNNPQKVILKNEDADILLTLNKEIKSSVFLTASHGNLFSDFLIHKESKGSVTKAAERINGGGAVISIETKNGSITLKKQ